MPDTAHITKFPIHPLCELLPRMTPAEYAALKADIAQVVAEVGAAGALREKIILLDGQVLDGRHRQDVLAEMGIEIAPHTVAYDTAWGDPVKFVYSKAIHRNLSETQKACAAVGIEEAIGRDARERSLQNLKQNGHGNGDGLHRGGILATSDEHGLFKWNGRTRGQTLARLNRMGRAELERHYHLHCSYLPTRDMSDRTLRDGILERAFGPARYGKSRDQAAGLFGVSARYVQDAKWLKTQDPKLFAECLSGGSTLPRAKAEVRRRQKRASLAAALPSRPGREGPEWDVLTGDCHQRMEELPRHAFRLAFMDIPYNLGIDYGDGPKADRLPVTDYLKKWGHVIGYVSRELLTPDGSLWFLINDEWADYFGLLLRVTGMPRRGWIKWYESFGVNCRDKFSRTSRHLFYHVRDAKRFVFNHEAVNRRSDRQAVYGDKRAHPDGKVWDDVWGINPPIPRLNDNHSERLPDFKTQLPLDLLRAIVGVATEPGDQVLDPACGSATAGAAAVELGRRFVGIELNAARAEQARRRLAGVTPRVT